MKYLFFDIDGTLLSHTRGISPKTIEGLRLLKENGHKIFICTGRSYAEIPELIYQFNFDGIIAAAGEYVRVGDKILHNYLMPEHLIDNIIYHIDQMNIPYVLEGTEASYSHKEALYISDQRDMELKKLKDENPYEHSAYDYRVIKLHTIDEYFENRTPISKITLYGNGPESYFELEQFIDEDFYLIKYEQYAELVAKGHNKFTGIQVILDYFGANVNDTLAFGDSLNDYDMIKNCNVGVAVGNASEPVKKIADYVTDDIHDEGIFNALKHLELI